MKNFLILSALIVFNQLYAQIPQGYYNGAAALSGIPLKAALHGIIDNHLKLPYTASTTDVWDILKETDKDPNNPSNVILFYTGWSVNAAQEWNNSMYGPNPMEILAQQ